MKALDGVYVVDSLENIGNYAAIGPNFAKACGFVARGGFDKLKPGRNVIDGDEVFVNCDEPRYLLRGERAGELHRKYFDIHIPLESDECIGFAAEDRCAELDYDEAADFARPLVEPGEWITVRRGEFAICWPATCAHWPAVATDEPTVSRKLIVKVRAR